MAPSKAASALRRRRLVSLALALAAAPACRPTVTPPALRRLDTELGVARTRTLHGDTRQAVRLHPGERRVLDLDLPEGGVLSLALAAGGSDAAGFARLRASIDGRTLLDAREHPRPWPRWRSKRAELPPGRARLEFEASYLDATGAPAAPAPGAAWLEVGSARVRALASRPARRVLVWISLDTVRADRLSLYGSARATTPHLEHRAHEWQVFEQAVAPASWTLPSMVSLLTSRPPAFHGVLTSSLARSDADVTLFERLAQAGFSVLGVSANRFVTARYNLAAGFDSLTFTPGQADEVNRLALRALDDWPGGDLALFVHYLDPHAPYGPPEPWTLHFDPRAEGSGWPPAPGTPASPAERERLRARYDAELAWTDDRVDALLAALEGRGLLQSAVLVLSADHGEELDDRGAWGHGHSLYEELLHVPLALGLPGRPGRRIAEPVSLVDVAPTLLELLGLPAPPSFQGRSLVPLIEGRSWPAQPIVAETSRDALRRRQIMVRQGSLKFSARVVDLASADAPLADERLYDLERDPGERQPLGTHPSREQLRQRLLAYAAAAARHGAHAGEAQLERGDREQLRALGYVE